MSDTASSAESSASDVEFVAGPKSAEHRRSCTDVFCIPIFFAALVGLGYILQYARVNGDMARVFHGVDFNSNVCGVSQAVEGKPYLFWCATPSAAMTSAAMNAAGISSSPGAAVMSYSNMLDLAHPICVSSCPNSSDTFNACFQRELVSDGPRGVTGTFTKNITYEFDFVADHPTTKIAERYCMPKQVSMLDQLKSTFNGGMEGLMFHAAEVMEDWYLVAAAAVLAVFLGFAYLFLVKCFAKPCVYVTFVLSSLGCILFGVYMMLGAQSQSTLDTFIKDLKVDQVLTSIDTAIGNSTNITMPGMGAPTTGNKGADTAIAVACMLLGIAIAIAGCCMRRSINLVVASFAATLECLQDMPILLLQPLVSSLLRVAFMLVAFAGGAWVLSVGQVHFLDVGSSYIPAGVARSFSLQGEERYMLAGYVFIALWLLEFLKALDQFVLIYGVQMWFFAPYGQWLGRKCKKVRQIGILRGICIGLTYHLGSLAFGSAILAVMRFLYFALSLMFKQMQAQAGPDQNRVVAAAAGCCLCCLRCWENVVRYFNKMAYIVICMNSQNFCSAAGTVVGIVASEFAALGLIEWATKFFQLGGILSITSAGAYLVWLLLTTVPTFSSPASPHFVPQPESVTVAAGAVSLVVAATFMDVFDTLSDAILVCWALDKRNREKNGMAPNPHLPAGLRRMLPGGGKADEQEQLVS